MVMDESEAEGKKDTFKEFTYRYCFILIWLEEMHVCTPCLGLGSQFPLREYKIPPDPKILENCKNCNLAHPAPVLKITEKNLKKCNFSVSYY